LVHNGIPFAAVVHNDGGMLDGAMMPAASSQYPDHFDTSYTTPHFNLIM
jgi:hypothetical protein